MSNKSNQLKLYFNWMLMINIKMYFSEAGIDMNFYFMVSNKVTVDGLVETNKLFSAIFNPKMVPWSVFHTDKNVDRVKRNREKALWSHYSVSKEYSVTNFIAAQALFSYTTNTT